MSPRPPKPGPTKTYADRVAANLRRLRTGEGLTMEGLADRLAALGHPVPLSTLYAYELGTIPLPLNLAPAYAAALRCLVVPDLFIYEKPPRLPRRFAAKPAKL